MHKSNMLTAVIFLLALYLLMVPDINCKAVPADATLVTETYTVQPGDNLWTIADRYMQKNTYAPREIREFYHGIIEANYDTVFRGRMPGMIYPGDKLQINYWTQGGKADAG